MITMSTYTVYEYMKDKFPSLANVLGNGFMDKRNAMSIGIFLGSDTRSGNNLAIGGLECTSVRMLPINIQIRWSENKKLHDEKAIEIYDALLTETQNFEVGSVKIAYIQMLDPCPVTLGRDDKNICESIIRANFYYYI